MLCDVWMWYIIVGITEIHCYCPQGYSLPMRFLVDSFTSATPILILGTQVFVLVLVLVLET